MLKYIESILKKDYRPYGPRLDDPEWAAAELITQFRLPTNWNGVPEKLGGEPLHDCTIKPYLGCYRGNVYVTQHLHQDIESFIGWSADRTNRLFVFILRHTTQDTISLDSKKTHRRLYRRRKAVLPFP